MVAQLKIYPYGICTVNQENQSAIQEFHMGQLKIYPFGICNVYQKNQSAIHESHLRSIPNSSYTGLSKLASHLQLGFLEGIKQYIVCGQIHTKYKAIFDTHKINI